MILRSIEKNEAVGVMIYLYYHRKLSEKKTGLISYSYTVFEIVFSASLVQGIALTSLSCDQNVFSLL